jgi:N-acetylglucosaminyldiphosphoundecaprenol N-acetyl-beta-D-mannosaminyltransferase
MQYATDQQTRPAKLLPRVTLLDVQVDRIDRIAMMQRVAHACSNRLPLHIATVSVHFVTLARRNSRFRDAINRSDISVADGRLLLWATRLAGRSAPEQITGHEIFRDGVTLAHQCRYRVYLLGGGPGVAKDLAGRLRGVLPGLAVQGSDGGMFSSEGHNSENHPLLEQIKVFDPHLIFIALGAPKQDLWIVNNQRHLSRSVVVGVGSVFDTETNRLPRAPKWMQIVGLESVFQLLIAPRRYARRYLLEDPPTFMRMLAQAIRQRFHALAP